MATEFITTLKAGTGNYTSIGTWLAAAPLDITATALKVFSHGGITGTVSDGDTVTGQTSGATGTVEMAVTSSQILITVTSGTFTSGEVVQVTSGNSVTISDAGAAPIVVLECYKGDYTSYGGGTNYIREAAVTMTGYTTSSTSFFVIRTPTSERHDGTFGTGFQWKYSTNFARCFNANADYTQVIGVSFDLDGIRTYGINVNATGVVMDACLIKSISNDRAATAANGGTIRNTLAMDAGTQPLATIFAGSSYSWGYFHNCTAVGNTTSNNYGYNIALNAYLEIINCVFYDNGGGGVFWTPGATTAATTGYNASSTYTTLAPPDEVGSSNYTSNVVSGDFVNAAANDFHLSSGSNLLDIGNDLSGTFTTDVDGDTRDANWDIGFDEIADVTAPILSSPTGTKTGSTTASGTVTTDEGNGTLYYLASTNASESAATIKTGSSQAVSGTGSQAVSFTGLTANTTYYAHYVQDDAVTNTSNVVSSTSFTTDKAPITIGNCYWDAATGWEYAVYNGGTIPSDSVMFYDTGTDDTSAAAAFLTDSSASWTINEWVGFRVINETDGSSGVITANTATTITATLSGGVGNNWDSGDVYNIVIDAAVNDQIVYEEATSLGGTVSAMSTKGVPTITGASGTHAFDVKYRDVTDSKVSSTVTVTVTV